MPFKIGDRVQVTRTIADWGDTIAEQGDRGTLVVVRNSESHVSFDNGRQSYVRNEFLKALPKKREKRLAEVLVPETQRDKVAVRMARKMVKGHFKATAFKVESEGNLQRRDQCGASCTLSAGKPHSGCKRFTDNRVANDFILRHLAKYGLARRVAKGESTPWGYCYTPKLPLVFSKVYNDSETEWTTTVSLKKANDILYAPMIVDAFNALAKANGNGINVTGSGMHTAYLQGEDGFYPVQSVPAEQNKMFENFARSMRPLLPALYFLGVNRIEDGVAVTRSTSPRQPLVSNREKYSAIAYRYGAAEFRVFDTCYEHRDQLQDNLVTMANAISKYWQPKYVKPAINLDTTGVLFGNSDCQGGRVNPIESLYVVREHVVLLNEGLRCIKPQYLSVKEVKQVRNFNLTVRGITNVLDTENANVQREYASHLRDIEVQQAWQAAREYLSLVDNLQYRHSASTDIKAELKKFRAKATNSAKKIAPKLTIQEIAYKRQFGQGFPLGDN